MVVARDHPHFVHLPGCSGELEDQVVVRSSQAVSVRLRLCIWKLSAAYGQANTGVHLTVGSIWGEGEISRRTRRQSSMSRCASGCRIRPSSIPPRRSGLPARRSTLNKLSASLRMTLPQRNANAKDDDGDVSPRSYDVCISTFGPKH